jgi:hypothetical protein
VIDAVVDDDRLAVLGCLDAAALYYKSGGYPWRLPRREDDLATCFLGVSFFQTLTARACGRASPRCSTSAASEW